MTNDWGGMQARFNYTEMKRDKKRAKMTRFGEQ